MRIHLRLDDDLGRRLRAGARERGLSLGAFLAEAGRAALARPPEAASTPFRIVTWGRGGVRPGIDLHRTSALLARDDKRG